jgi:DNA processing protein
MLSSISIHAVPISGGVLHVAGDPGLLATKRAIAIVGARAASRAGRERAHRIAAELTREGWIVFSGGALGIDSAAHTGALSAGGSTVAIVAGGVCTPYPERNRPLFDLITSRGALASPFGESTPIRRWHFVRRNAVLAEVCRAVLVVEARPGSGSLHTVAAARAAGRVVAAVPGSPATDALLAAGVAAVESAGDLLQALAGRPRAASLEPVAGGSEAGRALAALDGRDARSPVRVAELSGMTVREATRGLVALELSGHAVQAPGGGYRRQVVGI